MLSISQKSIVLLILLGIIFGIVTPPANANESLKMISVLYDTDTDKKNMNVIQENGELYMTTEDLAEVTGYKLSQMTDNVVYSRGLKKVNIDIQTNTMIILGNNYSLKPVIKEKGKIWLPMSELLPWLNVSCYVENGVPNIASDPVSYWEIEQNFNPMDYYFLIEDELGGKKSTVTVMLSMFLFDTILGIRTDRAIAYKGETLRDYSVYMDTFKEFATDDIIISDFVLKAIKSGNQLADVEKFAAFLQNYAEVNKAESLSKVLEPFDDIQKEIRELKEIGDKAKLKELWGALNIIETSMRAQQDYYKSFEYIYNINSKLPESIAEMAAYKSYEIFKSKGNAAAIAVLDFTGNCLKEIAKDRAKDAMSKALQNHLVMLNALDAVLSIVWPVNKSAEEIANLPVYVKIQQDALNSYNKYSYPPSNMSKDNIIAARLSAIMYLQAGRKAVESKQKLMDQFGGKGLSDSKIELYNEQITQLVLSASATENDAIDDKSANTAGLLELFKTIEYADAESIAVWQELYISKAKPYIDEGHHYYQFCLYDIDKNGIPELMLKPTGARLPGTAYTVNQGGIIGLEGIIWGNLYASRRPQSIVSSGSAGTGMLFTTLYTLNDNKLVEMGKLTYDEHSEDYPDHRFFFNGNKISEKEYERIYSELISEASKLTWEPLDEKTLHYSLTNNSR